MIRTYGKPPYRMAVVHGGPGACGSLSGVAEGLSKQMGTLEPIQSKHSIEELLLELNGQLRLFAEEPVFLLGHSWGAWLSVLYASRYKEMVKGLILVGSGPFDQRYVPRIAQRRMDNLTCGEQEEFRLLLDQLERDGGSDKVRCMASLKRLTEKADFVQRIPNPPSDELLPDGEMYAAVWKQASELRSNGGLLESLRHIHCPVCVIQGQQDPHPVEGVLEPLERQHISFESHILKNCGHSPFEEQGARDAFYELVDSFCRRHI